MFASHCAECIASNTRSVQVAILTALGLYVERLVLFKECPVGSSDLQAIISHIVKLLDYSFSKFLLICKFLFVLLKCRIVSLVLSQRHFLKKKPNTFYFKKSTNKCLLTIIFFDPFNFSLMLVK